MIREIASSHRLRILVAFALIYFVWGSTYLAIRFAIETIPPFAMASLRFWIAGGALYALSRWQLKTAPTRRQWLNAAFIGALMFGAGNGLVSWAELTVPSGMASLIIATVPLWMTLMDSLLFRAARPGGRVIAGLVLGMSGVVILVDPWSGSAGGLNPAGTIALLIACLAWSYASLRSRVIDLPRSPFVTAGMQMLGGAAALLVCSPLLDNWSQFDAGAVSLRSLGALAYLIVFGSMLALSAYTWLIRTCPASTVSTYAWVNPVIAVMLGAWLGGEVLTTRSLLAGVLIIVSVVLIVSHRVRVRPRRTEGSHPAAKSVNGSPNPGATESGRLPAAAAIEVPAESTSGKRHSQLVRGSS